MKWVERKEDFIQAVKEEDTIADVLRRFDLAPRGGNYQQVKKYIKKWELDPEFPGKYHGGGETRRSLEEVMTKDSGYNASHLKGRLIKQDILEYKCAICGNKGKWQGEDLSLQLDHINGDHRDHRKENLRFLCPNCHSQTDTWASKNIESVDEKNYCKDCGVEISKRADRCKSCAAKKRHKEGCYEEMPTKIDWLPTEELIKRVRETSYAQVGRELGVSDNAIRKRIENYSPG